MKSKAFVELLAAAVLLSCVGCQAVQKPTTVQKGSALGGGAGGLVGAGIGHLTTVGGVPGGLIGLGLGATAGAIAAEHYYGSDDQQAATNTEETQNLRDQIEVKDTQVSELREALQKEMTQKQALLEAHEKALGERDELRSKFGRDVAVSKEPAGAIKLTILSEVLFDSGKAKLTSKGKAVLSQAVRSIQGQFPDSVVEIRGHTDNVPIRYSRHSSNWELSCARALSVVHYLIEAENFSPQSLMAVGMGDTRPVASNDTPEGRRMNRRAEIVIWPDGRLTARELE